MRYTLNTQVEALIQIIFLLARVRECNVGEGNDRRRELGDVWEDERKRFGGLDLFDETGGLHLIDNLLLRFCLFDEIGVCTCGSDEAEDKVVSILADIEKSVKGRWKRTI
jgi:hypothetical protein